MEHEYTVRGRIFPELDQVQDISSLRKFINKMSWVEQDFESLGLKIDERNVSRFSMKSEDLDNAALEQACQNLSMLLGCKVILSKDHEVYGVANVFNGGSDYEVVDEDCYLWIYERGARLSCEKTKFWNEKFTDLEQKFAQGAAAKALQNLDPIL